MLTPERVVLVTLAGGGGALCDLTRQALHRRSQQLAWTVVTSLGVPTSTSVRVVGPKGSVLIDDVVPDPAVLASA